MVPAMADRRRKSQKRSSRGKKPSEEITPQVGRRPSPPGLLFAVAGMWIAGGITALVALSANWKLIPGIVFIGIGVLYLRGALTTVARRGKP
jgi:hypothetical protein